MANMAELRELRESLASFIETKEDVVKLLESNPDNEEFKDSLRELESEIANLQSTVNDLERSAGPQVTTAEPTQEPEQEPAKWTKESHPAFKRAAAATSDEAGLPAEHVYEVGQTVMAKYYADHKFYSARITSQTGSRADPVFTVTFIEYGNTESVKVRDLRPLPSAAGNKRKAEAPASGPTPSSKVISAAADVDANKLRQHREEESSDGPELKKKKRPEKKISTTKRLESARGSWQDFQSKGKPGMKKESMFKNKDRFESSGKPPSGGKTSRERMY